jgi:hypothetical protein
MTPTRRLAFALLATYGLAFGPAFAQAPPKPPEGDGPIQPRQGGRMASRDRPKADADTPTEYLVIPLKYASVDNTATLLQQLLGPPGQWPAVRIVSDARRNTLLIVAPAARVAEIRSLVEKIDVRPTAEVETPRYSLKVFALRTLEPDKDVEAALRLALSDSQNNRFALDRPRRQVMVYADDAAMKTVEALLNRLESTAPPPVRDVQVRVVWLVSGLADAPPPPEDLKDVLPGLAKLGYDRPRLAAQALVNVTANAEFQAKGVANLGAACPFSVTGRLDDKKAPPALSISLMARRERGERPPEELCNLQTVINAPVGHMVVLGVTPTGAMTSIFVVQVLRPDAAARR